MKKLLALKDGVFRNNPVFVKYLALFFAVGATDTVLKSLYLGAFSAVVIIISAIMVSAIKKIIPEKSRILFFAAIISFVTVICTILIKAFFTKASLLFGMLMPLVAANFIAYEKAEFSYKNGLALSLFDAVGNALGFVLSLVLIGFVREAIGLGTLFRGTPIEIILPFVHFHAVSMPFGGFLVTAFYMALFNALFHGIDKNRKEEEAK